MIRLLGWELKKLLMKQKGLYILLLFAVIHFSVSLTAVKAGDVVPTVTQNKLDGYYAAYSGQLTAEREAAIEEIRASIDTAGQLRAQAESDHYMGLISDEELDEILRQVTPLTRQESAFYKFYTAFQYCSSNSEQRYLIDTRGWTVLSNKTSPNFLLLFTACLLGCLVFKEDSKLPLKRFLSATPGGNSGSIPAKWLSAVVALCSLWLLAVIIDVVSVALIYPLPYILAPLQSIPTFAEQIRGMRIIDMLLVSNLIRLLGVIQAGLLALCLTEILHNPVLGCFIPFACSVLSYFSMAEYSKFLILPLPASLECGVLYFYTDHAVAPESFLTSQTCVAAVLGAIILTVGTLLLNFFHYHGLRLNWRKK